MTDQPDIPHAVAAVDYLSWIAGVVCWDGVLPVVVLAIPQLAIFLGADRAMTEFLSVGTPLLAFFIRIEAGRRHIAANHCGSLLRACQYTVFFFAAVLLVCIDTLMLLAMEMNNGRLWANQTDLLVWAGLLSTYFLAMLFALFPGRRLDRQDPNGPL